jgi:hypothetical protein
MTMLSADQVKALAPDPASLKAGGGLADARHWVSLGGDEAALWGQCKGSGKEPYKVRIDLANNGADCTCPSRKYPCKHSLGLMLLAATSPAKLQESTPPAWVSEWLEKRMARRQAPEKKSKPKTDEASRQKEATRRAAKREKLAETGLAALELWLQDFARRGLAFAQNAPSAFWEEQAARLVDAQLPGAARMIREMSTIPGSRPDWTEVLLLWMGRLFLLIQAYRKLDCLPEAIQQDVRYLLGWTVNQEELIATNPGVYDDWMVIAQTLEEDEKTGLRTQVNWLWGKSSVRPAQILNFAYRTQPLDMSLVPGLVLRGELVYFPGAYPLRAVFKNKEIVQVGFSPTGYPIFNAFLEDYASALGKNPWLERFPAILENVIPGRSEPNWFLQDTQNRALPLAARFSAPWELFTISGGHPVNVFGLWDGFSMIPMSVWSEGRKILL